MGIFWLVFIAAAVFVYKKDLRQQYFLKPLLNKLGNALPTISDTEREAIEAGDVWWERDLFSGQPDWQKLLAMPKPQLSAEEENFLKNQVEHLCQMIDDWQVMQKDHNLPAEVWEYLKTEKFFGMIIPKEYGGLGFSALAHSTIISKIGSRSVSAAVTAMVPNSLGPAELLLHYGTDEQKNYYLPRLAIGKEIPCFALTAPEAGSDAGAIMDFGIVCRGMYQGKEVLGMRLTWDKRYITLAPVATVLGLAFRLYDPDHLLGQEEDLGITLCLVPTNHPGVEIGRRHLPLMLAFMNGPTQGKDVFVPIEWIIGGVSRRGQGWKMLMECLAVGRSISLPALSTTCGKLAFLSTGAYARLRKQFNVPIANFEGVEEALSTVAGYTYLLESCRTFTAGAVDMAVRPSTASAIAKYHMTEMARKIVSAAMDVEGGHGIQMGPRNYLANAYLAIPVSITVEGANILTRSLIIFGQGAVRCHPFILEEIAALSLPEGNEKLQRIDTLLLTHMGYLLRNFSRTLCSGLTGGFLLFSSVHGTLARYYRQLTRMSSALAFLSDVSMILLGGNLKRKEHVSARLGDILSQLYLASSVLKYFHDHGEEKSDIQYVHWCVTQCLYQIQVAIDELLDNYPPRWLGKILRFIVFPWGIAYHKPRDMLNHQLVKNMITSSDFRQQVLHDFYLSPDQHDPIHQLQTALAQVEVIEPIWKKYQQAIRQGHVNMATTFDERVASAVHASMLTAEEANTLCEFNRLHKDIIQVNEFSFDFSKIEA
ncbi:acyl-CoA dehydrogenase [Gammaproteobacteria bacterium SCGC AG-212-F23]|nr:acyl-CoA dehydrogenase [Gammaproteobacteria bacterium SCGC AG-212-F23]